MSSTSAIPDTGLVIVDSHNKQISLSYSNATLKIKELDRRDVEYAIPVSQVLWVELTEDTMLRLSLLHRKKKSLALWKISGTFDPMIHGSVMKWTESLMNEAYEGRRHSRRLKVIINPHGGPGKARSIFEEMVKPIFEAANCVLDVMITEYNKHCYEYCKTMTLDYDAIVLISGDGLVHEVFNAFFHREDATDALTLPVVQIPAGSANGMSLSLLGPKDGGDVRGAALNAIKGQQMKIDLCSVKQEGKRIVSFMSQAIGMMADIDLGTESLRWMGETRFIVGFLREVGANKRCPVKLEIKVVAQDKKTMVQTYRTRRGLATMKPEHINDHVEPTGHFRQYLELPDGKLNTLTPSLPDCVENDGDWTTIDKPLIYVYAGKLPYVSSTFLQFPIAISNDGLIDIVAQEQCSRRKLLKGISGAVEGKQYWMSTQHYFKAKAYRVTPLINQGNFSIDGEKYPFIPFEVEILPQMGTTLGNGGWYPEFQ